MRKPGCDGLATDQMNETKRSELRQDTGKKNVHGG